MAKRGTGGSNSGSSLLQLLTPKGVNPPPNPLTAILKQYTNATPAPKAPPLLLPQHINPTGAAVSAAPVVSKATKAKTPTAPIVASTATSAPASIAPVGKMASSSGPIPAAKVVNTSKTGSTSATSSPDLYSYAKSIVQGELTPQLNSLTRQGNEDQATTFNSIDLLNQMLNRQQGDTSSIYSKLGNYIGQQQANTDASYGNTQQQVGQNYSDLQSKLGQLAQTAQTNTGNELQRLGIQAVAPAALAQSSADGSFLQGVAATGSANHLSALQQAKAASDALASQQQSDQQATAASLNGQFARTNQQNVSSALADLASKKYDLQGQASDLQGQTGTQIQQLMTQLQATALDNQIKQATLQGTLGLQGAQSNYYNAKGQADLTTAAQGSMAKPESALQQALDASEIQKNLAEASGTGSSAGTASGLAGATSYLNSLNTDPTTKAALQAALTHVATADNLGVQNNQADMADLQAFLTKNSPTVGTSQLGAAQNALAILLGTYGKS